MGWVWIVAAVWVLLGIVVALLIVRSVAMADRKTAEDDARFAAELDLADEPNVVIDRPPLSHIPESAPPAAEEPEQEPTVPDVAVPTARDAPTIPGLPSARPPVGRPPVPRSVPQRPQRRSGMG